MALEAVEMQLQAAQETNPWPGGAAQVQQMGSEGAGRAFSKAKPWKSDPVP